MAQASPDYGHVDSLLVQLSTRLEAAKKAPPFVDETLPRLLADAYALTYHLFSLCDDGVGKRILKIDVQGNGVRVCNDREGKTLIDLHRYDGMDNAGELRGMLDQVFQQIDALLSPPEGPVATWERIESMMP